MKLYLIISQILFALSLIPWFIIWGLSFMSFDSGVNLANSSFVLAISLYPVAVIVGSIIAWVFRVKKKRFAIMINLVPLLWIIVFMGFMVMNN
ncbi:hypothetical protein QE429_004594 [Bacillus sp. SORGH_AS 510]|uniref:hypothetical protein n=1 Tax=Bacillus sp. SORGH_AS_0510 TaxID=3041771 RepID=UPI0027824C98|nr:hypothetical protein [Bacillus sp. SORGH_AS_0510]MDQ1147767.1 hypothetical protein [Bacillus sp. SORGH_AS_0510]